jgi:hypothetical protein
VELHILFLDFKETYDSINRSQLFRITTKLGVPTKLVNLTKMTMGNSMGRVKIQRIISQPFTIQNGLRQGDPLSTIFSTWLYNIYTLHTMLCIRVIYSFIANYYYTLFLCVYGSFEFQP